MNSIIITHSNVEFFRRLVKAFRRDIEMLAKYTRRRPIECKFDVYRIVFTKKEDILDLINVLDKKIANV